MFSIVLVCGSSISVPTQTQLLLPEEEEVAPTQQMLDDEQDFDADDDDADDNEIDQDSANEKDDAPDEDQMDESD